MLATQIAARHVALHAHPPRLVRVDGCAIHHIDTGARIEAGAHIDTGAPAGLVDGDPVLLLPGIVATHRYFRKSILPLARRFRVLAPDLPGFGRSDKPDAPYTIDWFAEMVIKFLDAKGIARAHVVGNSMGGQIAMAAALAHPERIARLVLAAPAGISTRWLRGSAPLLDALGRAVPSLASSRVVSRLPAVALMSLIFRHAFPGRPDLALRYTRGYRRAIHSDEYPLYLRALFRSAEGVVARPMLEHARRITHETLILWGRHDRLLSVAAAPLLQRNIPRSRLIIYEGSGHVPMEDDPDRFNRDVVDFLGAA